MNEKEDEKQSWNSSLRMGDYKLKNNCINKEVCKNKRANLCVLNLIPNQQTTNIN